MKISFIKTDDNIVINEKCIRWVKKIDECLNICVRSNGCSPSATHKICKIYNEDSYNKLNKYFE